MKITGYIEKDPETNMYIATVPFIPGAHTQAESLDALQKNLIEVVELCLQEMSQEEKMSLPEFVGLQQMEQINHIDLCVIAFGDDVRMPLGTVLI